MEKLWKFFRVVASRIKSNTQYYVNCRWLEPRVNKMHCRCFYRCRVNANSQLHEYFLPMSREKPRVRTKYPSVKGLNQHILRKWFRQSSSTVQGVWRTVLSAYSNIRAAWNSNQTETRFPIRPENSEQSNSSKESSCSKEPSSSNVFCSSNTKQSSDLNNPSESSKYKMLQFLMFEHCRYIQWD